MKKLELKNLTIKTLSVDGQTKISGGRMARCTGVNTDDCNSGSRTCTIPDAPGGSC